MNELNFLTILKLKCRIGIRTFPNKNLYTPLFGDRQPILQNVNILVADV